MSETMLTIDELQQMDDLSGSALYWAEVKRIPLIPRTEQDGYIEAARGGDEAAQQDLLTNCLNWTLRRAYAICRDYPPDHSDMMDLVGIANLKMTEALPRALKADDPVAYIMSTGAREMSRYCRYDDPLIRHPKDWPPDKPRTGTLSLEGREPAQPGREAIAAPDDYQLVYQALSQLSPRHRIVLTAAYGLHGEARHSNEDIAAMLNLPKGTVEKYLWRAKRRLAHKLGPYLGELGLRQES